MACHRLSRHVIFLSLLLMARVTGQAIMQTMSRDHTPLQEDMTGQRTKLIEETSDLAPKPHPTWQAISEGDPRPTSHQRSLALFSAAALSHDMAGHPAPSQKRYQDHRAWSHPSTFPTWQASKSDRSCHRLSFSVRLQRVSQGLLYLPLFGFLTHLPRELLAQLHHVKLR
jgi:hypothetical protein